MIALDISKNGERMVLAGFEDWAILGATLTAHHDWRDASDEFDIDVRGLAQPVAEDQFEYVRWGRKKLSVGDAITIRIVQVSTADSPIKRFRENKGMTENPFTEEELLKMQKEDYLFLKKKFEGESEGND